MNPSHLSTRAGSEVALPLEHLPQASEKVKAMYRVVSRAEKLLQLLLREPVRATPPSAWTHFAELSADTQRDAICGIEGMGDFIQGALDQNIDGFDELGMLKYAADKLSLLSEHDAMEDISTGDVVEIFDSEHRQVYRSYSCFALSNYSLLELATYPWFELYERSNKVESDVITFSNSILNGEASYVLMSDLVQEYTIRECRTVERAVFALQEKFLRRMKGMNSRQNYCLSVKTVRELATSSKNQDIQFL